MISNGVLGYLGVKPQQYSHARSLWLFFWQHNHCAQAYADELDRKQLSPEMRGTPAVSAVAWPTAQPYMPPGVDPDDR